MENEALEAAQTAIYRATNAENDHMALQYLEEALTHLHVALMYAHVKNADLDDFPRLRLIKVLG